MRAREAGQTLASDFDVLLEKAGVRQEERVQEGSAAERVMVTKAAAACEPRLFIPTIRPALS